MVFFSYPIQVKVYAYTEPESTPQFLDQSQRGTVTFEYEFSFLGALGEGAFISLSLSEYVFVSLSVALIIAKFVPSFHNQILSRATRLEHQSVYWGVAMVSNVFTYGLLFLAGRVYSIFFSYFNTSDRPLSVPTVLSVQGLVAHSVLFVGALIPFMKGRYPDIPIPRGVIKILLYVSFCFFSPLACFLGHKGKTLQFMVMFSFMNILYHNIIMDAISIMFDEEARAKVISTIIFYVSMLVFLMLFVSF